MKKNLLTLSLFASVLTYAQDTYIGKNAIVKVQPNTLFYHGGNVTLSEASSEVVKNEGNIKIQGNYTNNSDPSTKGKEFINVWTDNNNYGQLIISQDKITTGLVAMERSLPKIDQIDEYILALPFKGTAKNVYESITNFQLSNSAITPTFIGDCTLNTACNTRYNQTFMTWDNSETEFDAVVASDLINPINRYLINSRQGSDFKNIINQIKSNISTGIQKVSFSGIPSNNNLTEHIISGLKGGSLSHEDKTYLEWKNEINNYRESYDSYLGNQQNNSNNSKLYGKNLHRLANPYTSNIDLSDINIENSWIYFSNDNSKTPTAVYDGALRFRIYKLANDFSITWNSQNGNTSTSTTNTTFSAYLSKDTSSSNPQPFFWTGSSEALLIKPYETFYVDYYAINRVGNGNTRIVTADVNLGDKQKTFLKSYPGTTPGMPPAGTYSRNVEQKDFLNNEELKAKGLVTDFDFTQLELFLSENSTLKGNAAYLLNANFMQTGNETSTKQANNNIFFYEENENGDVILDAETISNSFNSEDYIGKPLRIGFKNLENGNEYNMNMNLYEYSILNKVSDLNLGRYYLLDKLKNTVTEVDASTQITFVADDNINNRFEFYWNEAPRTLSTNDLSKGATYIYKNNSNQLIRFENNNTTAKVEIYDVTGKLINVTNDVKTSIDHKLNLSNVPNIYVVVITYKDGKVVTKKTINK